MDKIPLYLSLEQVNLILEVLSHQPYRSVATTLADVKGQADAHLSSFKPKLVADDA